MTDERWIWDASELTASAQAGAGQAGGSSSSSRRKARPTAVIVLNSPLPADALFCAVWSAASIRLCADGGANRLHDAHHRDERRLLALPDVIKGDFDSLRDDVRSFYEAKGVRVVHDPDEYSTDLGKCVKELGEIERERALPAHDLCILGGLSGRLDQTIHTLHALTQLSSDPARVQSAPQGARVWALSAESLACVLPPGKHLLRAPVQPENDGAGEDATHFFFGRTCGVLPVGAEARVATKGLSWNLGPSDYMYPTSIATAVSSSNHIADPTGTVELETDEHVVWTVAVLGA